MMNMSFALLVAITALIAYILGSVNGAIVTSKLFYRKDIREFGSGNAGLTNFFRVFGKGGVLLVILIDVAKTIAPVAFGGWLFAVYSDMELSQTWLLRNFFDVSIFGILLSGFFVELGHCFPLFYKFKGGKGVMAIGIIAILLDWRLALIAWTIFILIVLITRFVSLGSIIASASVPIILSFILRIGGYWELVLAILCSGLVIFRHSLNMKRLSKGEESKLSY
jgi:glycerol-3-phosphate acyltransferase PlsY